MIRTIEHAYCTIENDLFSLAECTNTQKERFELRKIVQRRERDFLCIECSQRLTIAVSNKSNNYFRHLPNSGECALKNATSEDIKSFNSFYASKESPRHIELKNKIGKRLLKMQDVCDVHIDDAYIISEGERRRPDVYCQYKGHKIAFEIQLSDLSIKYLSTRHEFYLRNGIYLIWILDNFNPERSTQLVRDIKYLSTYHNFFKLNENDENLSLICKFKNSFITYRGDIHDQWTEEIINLEDLTFNHKTYEVYFKDYLQKREELEERLVQERTDKEKKEEMERLNQITSLAEKNTDLIIHTIRNKKISKSLDYDKPHNMISKLTGLELEMLNNKINLSASPLFIEWILKAKQEHIPFLMFFLKCTYIKIDVKQRFHEISALSALMHNPNLIKERIAIELLKRGYKLTENDSHYFNTEEKLADLMLYQAAEKSLKDNEINQLFEDKNRKLFFIVQSLKQQKFINNGFVNWISFGNNLLQHYSDYWDYLEKAIKFYGIWDTLIKAESFTNKYTLVKFDLPSQKQTFKIIFDKIFPELS